MNNIKIVGYSERGAMQAKEKHFKTSNFIPNSPCLASATLI